MKQKGVYAVLLTLTAMLFTYQACSKVGFQTDSSSNGGNGAAGLEGYGTKSIQATFPFETSYSAGKVWVVTPPPTQTVNQITIDAAKTYPVKTWNYTPTGGGGGGSRTFVTSIGLVFARFPAQLFLVNDSIPTTQNLAPVWTGTSPGASTRACATSYKVSGAAYVGVAWTNSAGNRVFTQIPISGMSLNVAAAHNVVLGADGSGGAGWAYGCFTDQGHNLFWTATPHAGSGSLIYGVNLTTLTDVSSLSAPNAGKPIKTDATYANYFGDPATGSGSYALFGDGYGDVLVGKAGTSSIYTFAHETKSDLGFATAYNTSQLLVYPAKCGSGIIDCTGRVSVFATSSAGIGTGNLGPMSSLDDGRVVAISRGNPSAIYLLQPADPANISAGMQATSIAHIPGDAYMYSDFTGATLYSQSLDNTYDLRTFAGYNSLLPIGAPSFTWNSQTGAKGEAWVGLTLSARCFNANTASSTVLAPVTAVAPSGQVTSLMGLQSCSQPGFDHIEIAVQPAAGGSVYTRTIQITVSARQ